MAVYTGMVYNPGDDDVPEDTGDTDETESNVVSSIDVCLYCVISTR